MSPSWIGGALKGQNTQVFEIRGWTIQHPSSASNIGSRLDVDSGGVISDGANDTGPFKDGLGVYTSDPLRIQTRDGKKGIEWIIDLENAGPYMNPPDGSGGGRNYFMSKTTSHRLELKCGDQIFETDIIDTLEDDWGGGSSGSIIRVYGQMETDADTENWFAGVSADHIGEELVARYYYVYEDLTP